MSAGQGARNTTSQPPLGCGNHPDKRAEYHCSECGSFLCSECVEEDVRSAGLFIRCGHCQGLCEDFQERLQIPKASRLQHKPKGILRLIPNLIFRPVFTINNFEAFLDFHEPHFRTTALKVAAYYVIVAFLGGVVLSRLDIYGVASGRGLGMMLAPSTAVVSRLLELFLVTGIVHVAANFPLWSKNSSSLWSRNIISLLILLAVIQATIYLAWIVSNVLLSPFNPPYALWVGIQLVINLWSLLLFILAVMGYYGYRPLGAFGILLFAEFLRFTCLRLLY